MTTSNAQIDRLVREVMDRLGHELRAGITPAAPHNGSAASEGGTPSISSPPHNDTPSAPHALVLTQKLIALADVEGRVPKGGAVAIAGQAVITPAARDYLRAQQARIETQAAPAKSGGTGAARRDVSLAAAVGTGRGAAAQSVLVELPDRLASLLAKSGLAVQHIPHVSLPGTVAELAESVALGGSLGVLLTDEPAAAICLANRRRGVRAAAAANLEELEAAWAAIAVNLLVLNPRGTSSWQLIRLAQRYCGLAAEGGMAKYAEVLT